MALWSCSWAYTLRWGVVPRANQLAVPVWHNEGSISSFTGALHTVLTTVRYGAKNRPLLDLAGANNKVSLLVDWGVTSQINYGYQLRRRVGVRNI